MVKKVRQLFGSKKPMIAVGGIGCEPTKDQQETVWDCCFRFGAILVELNTGLIYGGPELVKRINAGLLRILHSNKCPAWVTSLLQSRRKSDGNDISR